MSDFVCIVCRKRPGIAEYKELKHWNIKLSDIKIWGLFRRLLRRLPHTQTFCRWPLTNSSWINKQNMSNHQTNFRNLVKKILVRNTSCIQLRDGCCEIYKSMFWDNMQLLAFMMSMINLDYEFKFSVPHQATNICSICHWNIVLWYMADLTRTGTIEVLSESRKSQEKI
jgi:hypothetical protein